MNFSLAFIFNSDQTKVLLVHKRKPAWQQGRLNGVGGKIEEGEDPLACIVREVSEETALNIAKEEWVYVGKIIDRDDTTVSIYATTYAGHLTNAKQMDHEAIEWFDVANLPPQVIENLRWFIPLALDKLHETGPKEVDIYYND